MIAIVGNAHDDILYFDKVLYNRREETFFNRYTVSIGTVFNQEVIVIHDLYSSTVASAVLTYVLSKYYIDLVFVVGKCYGIDKSTKSGDIVISTSIINVNADLGREKNVAIGEVPGFDREFKIQNDIITYLKKGINKRTYVHSYQAYFFSSDNLSDSVFEKLRNNRTMFGIDKDAIVVDSNSSGVAIACTLKDVPFVSIKVVQNQFDQVDKIDHYLTVLDRYIDLGKAVVSTIGDIGRNDVLRS